MGIREFVLLVLRGSVGGMFLCGGKDLISMFVGGECLSLCW